MRYIAFDVETPNNYNDRMSSIGIAVIEDKKIITTYAHLINPETYFNQFNIDLTGLSAETCRHEPNFKELWPEIKELMASGILVAHNARFDLSVLARCLKNYRIPHQQYVQYIDTVTLGRHVHPDFENHKLNTMSQKLHIELDHHKADSDSIACGKILINAMDYTNVDDFIRTFDLNKK